MVVGFNECDDNIRKMLNKNYLGKVPSKAAEAAKWKDLNIRHKTVWQKTVVNLSNVKQGFWLFEKRTKRGKGEEPTINIIM